MRPRVPSARSSPPPATTPSCCSLAAPCRGFARAASQTSPSGEGHLVLDSAGYGPVTITKSVSIIAPAGNHAGITVFSGDGITVNIPGGWSCCARLDDKLTARGLLCGIYPLAAQQAFASKSCWSSSNMGVDGVMYFGNATELIVIDTIRSRRWRQAGPSAATRMCLVVVLDHVRSEHNGTNGFYMAAFVAGEANASISNSVFTLNGSNGIWVAATDTSSTFAQIERSVVATNGAVFYSSGNNVGVIYADVVPALVPLW